MEPCHFHYSSTVHISGILFALVSFIVGKNDFTMFARTETNYAAGVQIIMREINETNECGAHIEWIKKNQFQISEHLNTEHSTCIRPHPVKLTQNDLVRNLDHRVHWLMCNGVDLTNNA